MKKEIEAKGRVTHQLRKKFFPGCDSQTIRKKLEEIGLDRHLPIELFSTEIAIKTPLGILMQIRSTDKDQLGLWGGVLIEGESPLEGAIRELKEETGILFDKNQLKFLEVNKHFHKYANGDKVIFTSFRFVLNLDYVPKIMTDEESVGAFMVVHTILEHQQEFVKRLLDEK